MEKKISIRVKNIMIEIEVLVEKTKTKKTLSKTTWREMWGGKDYKNTG